MQYGVIVTADYIKMQPYFVGRYVQLTRGALIMNPIRCVAARGAPRAPAARAAAPAAPLVAHPCGQVKFRQPEVLPGHRRSQQVTAPA